MGQAQIFVFEGLDVPHHFRFRAEAVEHGVMEIIHFAGKRPEEGAVKVHSLDGLYAQHRAQRREVLLVGAFVQGDPDVFSIIEVAKVHAL